jgi:hypothetical protein
MFVIRERLYAHSVYIRPTNTGFIKRGLFTSCIKKGGLFTKTVNVMDMKFRAYYASPSIIALLTRT